MNRKAVTKIELAVVVAIVAILVGLLFPSVERVRESSSRLRTNSNLKNCALATHGYFDNYKIFPDGFGRNVKLGKNLSLWSQLLPFLEAGPDLQNDAMNIVHAYQAPSDAITTDWRGLVGFAGNVRIFGHQTLLETQQPVNEPGQAVTIAAGPLISGLTLKDIDDGSSNTILMSTRYANCAGQRTWYAADAFGNCELGPLPSPGVGGFMGAGSSSKPASRMGDVSMMFQSVPTEAGCLPQAGIFGHSFGTGGMSVALCDGSVRNIRPDMSPTTFARALCPADKQKHSADWSDD
ncbi:MAG: DUF1559 domain-containing protein [Planctomycetota bacterium]